MPFGLPTGNLLHRVARSREGIVDLIAYLEILQRDSRAYHRTHAFRTAVIGRLHSNHSCLHDIGHRPAPAAVNDAGSMMRWVIYNNRCTVGSRHADTDTRLIGHQRIDAIDSRLPDIIREQEVGAPYLGYARPMYLMGHDQAAIADAQLATEQAPVSCYSLGVIAAEAVNVEFAVRACAEAATTGGAESGDAFGKIVIMEYRVLHGELFRWGWGFLVG